jgi:phenylalanyl-tRNA synthetase beta chain
VPVIAAEYEELVGLIGRRIPEDELIARVPMMGGAYEGKDDAGNLQFEFFPNRPDLLSIEGLARACRGFFDVKPGLHSYVVQPSAELVTVDPGVKKIRPVIGFAKVTNVPLNEKRLAQLIELQERLTAGPGRKRRKVAIGIHDAAPVKGPYTYKAVGRDAIRFIPLGASQPMTPAEIFAKHEKGRLYAHLLDGTEAVPVIVDSAGHVLSLPPIINGELTALTTRTRDVLVDVTGTDERAVFAILDIVVTALAERGGTIHSFQIQSGKSSRTTPDLKPIETPLTLQRAKQLLGLEARAQDAKLWLGRMGHDVETTGAVAKVRSPSYRIDILHPDDLVEDMGIGYGFDKFKGRLPERALFGGVLPRTKTSRRARTALLGLGFTEVATLTITGRRDTFELLQARPTPVVGITNPLTADQEILRPALLPSLLGLLRANKHRELPQAIFEVANVVPTSADGAKTELRAGAIRISPDANFSECKGLVESVLRDLDIPFKAAAATPPGIIAGRGAALLGPDGRELGWFGELRPDVITNFELGAPVIAFEFRLDASGYASKTHPQSI